jgi:hypothetical protein
MWSQQAIDAAVDAARSVVRGDGADLILVKADEKRARIDLKLDVTHLTCDDGTCLLPGRLLEPMIAAKLQEHLEGELEVHLEDPRQ